MGRVDLIISNILPYNKVKFSKSSFGSFLSAKVVVVAYVSLVALTIIE